MNIAVNPQIMAKGFFGEGLILGETPVQYVTSKDF
jgi:hypothetical protein